MQTSKCASCGREFPAERMGHFGVFCPTCGREVAASTADALPSQAVSHAADGTATKNVCCKCSMPLEDGEPAATWDGASYCRACVEAAGLAGFDPRTMPPLEEVRFSLGQAFIRAIWSWICSTTLVDLLTTSLFAAIGIGAICVQAAAGLPWLAGVLALPLGLAMFFAFGFALFSIVSLPLSFVACLATRCRTISVKDGLFIHQTWWRKQSAALTDCSWCFAKIGCDQYSYYWPGAARIAVRAGQQQFVCGFSPDAGEMWTGFFRLTGVHQRTAVGAAGWAKLILGGMTTGGAFGVAIGYAAALVSGNMQWLFTSVFLGAIDGLLAAMLFGISAANEKADWIKRHCRPALVSTIGAVLGLKVGFFMVRAGWPNVAACALLNGCVGLAIGLAAMRRAQTTALLAPVANAPSPCKVN